MSEEMEPVKSVTWSVTRYTVISMFGFLLIFYIINNKFDPHTPRSFGVMPDNIIGSKVSHSFRRLNVKDSNISSPDNNHNRNVNRPLTVNHDYCAFHYNDRRYFTTDEAEEVPPLLYSFPGSGNTWARLLIDHATGIFTGSIYDDKSLYAALPGEPSCNRHVSVVKVHPFTRFRSILSPTSYVADKCHNMIISRAILLIRDPYKAFWAEYERRRSHSHVDGVKREDFDEDGWRKAAWNMARSYKEMWVKDYTELENEYKGRDVLYVRYEDLASPDTKVDTLESILKLIGIEQPRERIECAFYLSDDTDTYRVRSEDDITIDEVYDEDLVCRMWELFGNYASKRGYKPFGGHKCK